MTTDRERIRFRQSIRRQCGVVSLDQATKAGFTRQAVARKVATKAWFAVGPRVYQVGEHDPSSRSQVFAATLSLGPDATLVGRSAAWWWQLLETAPAQVQVAVPVSCRPRPRAGVEILRHTVDPVDRTVVAGVAVTKRAPTVLDAGARLGLSEGARLVDRALQNDKVSLAALREVHVRSSGRRGAVLGGELIALAAGGARSWAERALHSQLRAGGFRGWAPNVEIRLEGFGVAVGDVVFDEERVILEVDGWAYHRDLRAFLRDGPRQAALTAADWTVLRTHWYEQREDPGAFFDRLRAVLRARSGLVERMSR